MSDRKWVPAYGKNGRETAYSFGDGSWVCFYKEVEDTRDMMSDLVKPSWDKTGNYEVLLIPSDKIHSSDWDFKVQVNTSWANKIWYNLHQNNFKTMKEFKSALRKIGTNYRKVCSHEVIELKN